MLRVILFYQKSQVYTYDYLDDSSGLITVVSPHPGMADIIHLKNNKYRPDLDLESITMADFRRKEIEILGIDKKIYKKYELLLELSVVWKKYFPDRTLESFLGSVDLFTDLRGFTTDFNLVEEGLSLLNKETSEVIEKFWKYLEARDIYDEHKIYDLLSQRYRQMDAVNCRSIVFYGFTHLSSGQCDLIKSLANVYNVYIPFNAFVYQNIKESSWIKWPFGECIYLPKQKSTSKKNNSWKNTEKIV